MRMPVSILIMGWVISAYGIGYAAPRLVACPLPWSVLESSSLSPLGERVARDGAFTSRRRTGEGVPAPVGAARREDHLGPASPKANAPKQLPHSQQRPIPGNSANVHRPGSTKPDAAARSVFGTANHALVVRTPNVVRSSAPSFNDARHRSPNPAVVSGSLNSHSHNTAAINGARVSRRP
jgi:hypothetical protein